jgi:hypothetical protein
MDLGELFLLLAAHLILTALPGIAATLFAARKGVREVPVLLAIGLAASGAIGILAFWSFYGERVIGEAFSYFVLIGSIALAAWSLHGRNLDRDLLRQLRTPLVLWALGSAFLLFLGFAHGGVPTPLATSASRFSGTLPVDNLIPSFFTEWFFHHGHHGPPPVYPGEWLASDRPPLQVGYMLSQRSFGWDAKGLNYQVLGVLLQQLWIVGLWALLVAARVGRLTRGLIMIVVLVSDLAIVNGFYVWPKMLPAAMLLGAAALVMTPLWPALRRNLWAAGLIATLCALAMLGHGSSIFGIIPLVLVAAYRGLPSWRWVGVGLAVGIVLMGSWSAYQKYGDPPGNRLTKWTLAGVVEIDDRGTLESIRDSYAKAGVDGTLHNKAENFVTMSGGGPAVDWLKAGFDSGDPAEIVRALRAVSFLYLLPSMGLLLLAPVAMVLARRRRREHRAEWSFALSSFAVFAIGAILWGLLVFGDLASRTVLHISSYLLPLLGMAGAVAGLRAVLPRFAIYYVGLAALLSLALYAPAVDPPPGSAYSPVAALAAVLSLAGFCFLTLRERGGGESLATPLSRSDSGEGARAPQPRAPATDPVEI